MSPLDDVCKFKVGDFVTFKRPLPTDRVVVFGLVIERWRQECYGGAQHHYTLRLSRRGETVNYLDAKASIVVTEASVAADGQRMPMICESELEAYDPAMPPTAMFSR